MRPLDPPEYMQKDRTLPATSLTIDIVGGVRVSNHEGTGYIAGWQIDEELEKLGMEVRGIYIDDAINRLMVETNTGVMSIRFTVSPDTLTGHLRVASGEVEIFNEPL